MKSNSKKDAHLKLKESELFSGFCYSASLFSSVSFYGVSKTPNFFLLVSSPFDTLIKNFTVQYILLLQHIDFFLVIIFKNNVFFTHLMFLFFQEFFI